MTAFSLPSQRLASLSELRSYYNTFCEYLATFPGEAIDDSAERERIKQRFSKFRFHHIRNYALDVADESERRLEIFETPLPDGADVDTYLILTKAKPARLKLANLPNGTFRSIVVDIHTELVRRYFGEDNPFEVRLRQASNARTAELYFAAGEEACKAFEEIFTNETKYRQLLAYRGDKAQTLLDLMSMLVDHPSLASQAKSRMIKTIMRLSQGSFLYPHSLLVKGIKRDDIPYMSGNFGDVYQGTFRGQAVGLKVVKLYKKSDLTRIFKLFSREAMLWAHLSHPNILPFYGIYRLGDMCGTLALISPWMEKGHLRVFLQNEPDADRILLLTDVVSGLEYLHENNIIHGDLKGDNILITPSGKACLADFGLSNIVQAKMEGWGAMSTIAHNGGTVGWEAPELLQGDHAVPTKESDVFALAMVFYEAFTGNMPFHEANIPAAVIFRIISGHRPTKPAPGSLTYAEYGLTEEIWGLMERGWDVNLEVRPPLREFLEVLSKCGREDQRRKDEFGEALPPSRFRDAMNGVYRRLTIEEIAHVISWFT